MKSSIIRKRWILVMACGALLASASAAPIPLPQLPPAVQKGIQAQSAGGTLGTIEREEEDGGVTYTFEVTKGGHSIDYTVDEMGSLVTAEVTLAETPPAVQKSIQAQIGKGELESIDKSTEDGKATYDVGWTDKDGKEHSFTVLEDGKLDSVQMTLEETSPAVQATIAKEAGAGQVKEISKTFDDGAAFYDASFNRDGVDREISVAENGRMESRQVLLSEVPPPVRNTIQQSVGKGTIVQINQLFENKKGGSPFEVEAVKGGKAFNFNVGLKGKFLGLSD